MFLEMFDERKIGAPVAALKDVFKISGRLVGMDEQGQMKFWRHEDVPGLHLSSYRERRHYKVVCIRA
jgi:hypothetical protein